jgi:predicted transcriptional regulator
MNFDDIEGVWIPREIWFNVDLSLQEKILFTQIKSLDRTPEGCKAGNSYFAKFMGISESRISEIIKSLNEKKFVKSKIIQHQTLTGIKTQRHIKSCVKLGIVSDPYKIDEDIK